MDTRIGDVTKRMDNMNANINSRIDDLRTQMNREHDNLSQKLDAHISEQSIHQPRGFNRRLRLRVGNRNSLLRSPVQTILPPSDPPAT